jgi:hypothetical protein
MAAHWFVQEGSFLDPGGVQRLIYAVAEAGGTVRVQRYTRGGTMDFNLLPHDAPGLFFGSIDMLQEAQQRSLPYRPLAWFDWDKLCCSTYYAYYGRHLLQRRYGFYPFSELRRLGEFLFQVYGKDENLFIRPDANSKSFSGELVSRGRFDSWLSLLADATPPEELCVVSQPEAIRTEWRFIVADHRAVTGSQYKSDGGIDIRPRYPPAASRFAEQVAAAWAPHPVFLVDVALTTGGEYRLVEIGSVNCAGFYQCDLHAAVPVIHCIAEREWSESQAK